MSTSTAAGLLLIGVPIGFNLAFGLLAARFDYPDILRRPTAEVLERFREGGSQLILLWWAFAMTAVLMVPLVVLLADSLAGPYEADGTLVTIGLFVGVLAATVQLLGLIRWPFLVPYLAREIDDPQASEARREAVDVVFQASNRYLGVGVGEHLGYLLTGAWSVLAGFAMTESSATPHWLGVIGVLVGIALVVGSFEFVGRFEPKGWGLAAKLTPIAYVVWSLWLAATGIALL